MEKPVASPDDANVEITAFEWGQGPVRVSSVYLIEYIIFLILILRLSQVRGVVDTSGTANLSISLTVPILGTVNIADLGVNIQTPSATANINLVIATGYATVSLDSTDIYLEVHIKSPFGNVDFDRTLIFSI